MKAQIYFWPEDISSVLSCSYQCVSKNYLFLKLVLINFKNDESRGRNIKQFLCHVDHKNRF